VGSGRDSGPGQLSCWRGGQMAPPQTAGGDCPPALLESPPMPYETFVGWRYLRRRREAGALAIFSAVGAATALTGLLLNLLGAPGWTAFALFVGGSFAALFFALLCLFSVFITLSVVGVVFGVAALTGVLAITSGFQREFQDKLLGVNAHILVMKYGLDFREYRDVMKACLGIPGVTGAAPFVFNEMMLTKGGRMAGVLIKGIDPERANQVL